MTTKNLNRTFGVEIECYAKGYTRTEIANRLNLITGLEVTGTDSYITRGNQTWTVKYDGSLTQRPSSQYIGVEIVSPPLKIYNGDGYNQVKKICDALEEIGVKVNTTCGLHVHIDSSDLTFKQKKLVAKRYAKFEDVIDYFMPKSRRRTATRYCASLLHQQEGTPVQIINQTLDKINSCRTLTALQKMFGEPYTGSRYAKLNFVSPYNTIEFRHHGGTTEYTKILNWITLCTQMVEAGHNNKPVKSICVDQTHTRTLQHRFKVFMKPLSSNTMIIKYFKSRMSKFLKEDGVPSTVGGTFLINRRLRQLYNTTRG